MSRRDDHAVQLRRDSHPTKPLDTHYTHTDRQTAHITQSLTHRRKTTHNAQSLALHTQRRHDTAHNTQSLTLGHALGMRHTRRSP